jgi:nucleotide-binding universal stress UspA family protein
MVAYDGSPHSKAAVDWAMHLGVSNGAELLLVKVFEPIIETYIGDFYSDANVAEEYNQMIKTDQQKMEDLKVFCKGACKIKVQVELLRGHVVSALLDYAKKNDIDLIVAGTKGYGLFKEILVGSITSSLVSLSKVPVLAVKEPGESTDLKKIIVAYDGSDFAKAALDMAIDIGKIENAKIWAVKVTDPLDIITLSSMAESGAGRKLGATLAEMDETENKILEGAKSAAALKEMEIETKLLPSGNIAAEILRFADEIEADMIVAGTLGHGLLGELLVGSVTRNLISLSKIPVLAVKK